MVYSLKHVIIKSNEEKKIVVGMPPNREVKISLRRQRVQERQ